MSLEWNEQFSVGVGKFDTQHQQVFRLLNKLITEQTEVIDTETISEIIMEMIRYSELHLSSEEQYMREYSYPDYESHRQLHLFYKKKVAELSIDALNKDTRIPRKLASFMTEWWTGHILNVDMKYKNFFAAKGVK
jgi:hemerythrin-like metal-binding protein